MDESTVVKLKIVDFDDEHDKDLEDCLETADVILAVYSIVDYDTLEVAQYRLCESYAWSKSTGSRRVPALLVGAKRDIDDDDANLRRVTAKEALEMAEFHECVGHFEVSAKTSKQDTINLFEHAAKTGYEYRKKSQFKKV